VWGGQNGSVQPGGSPHPWCKKKKDSKLQKGQLNLSLIVKIKVEFTVLVSL
jgi:hypothetical protein